MPKTVCKSSIFTISLRSRKYRENSLKIKMDQFTHTFTSLQNFIKDLFTNRSNDLGIILLQ